jgi:Holliday junction resolvase RusA-like endonuclease
MSETILDIELGGLPPLNSADGPNRWTRRRMRIAWEAKVTGAVLVALGKWPAEPLVKARITITRFSSTEPDFDGLVAGGKFLLDGLVKAGVIHDDRPGIIGQPVYRWEKYPPKMGKVQILVESL